MDRVEIEADIRDRIAAKGLTVRKFCIQAGVGHDTMYRLFKQGRIGSRPARAIANALENTPQKRKKLASILAGFGQ